MRKSKIEELLAMFFGILLGAPELLSTLLSNDTNVDNFSGTQTVCDQDELELLDELDELDLF